MERRERGVGRRDAREGPGGASALPPSASPPGPAFPAPEPPARRPAGPPLWGVLALLALWLLLRHGAALNAPFFSDDYLFLDKVRDAPFSVVWAPSDLAYHWYRPWSRELHYWTLSGLFGPRPGAFHAASFALWLTVMGLTFALARRVAGAPTAAIATCGAAALAAWGVPIEWSPGVQDLWMLVFSLLCLHAFARGRGAWAAAALALALLSKETAAVVPGIALGYALAIDRDRARPALARCAPLAAVALAWAAFHPALGGRLWWADTLAALPSLRTPPGSAIGRSLLALANLDLAPRPLPGWGPAIAAAAPGALALAAIAAWAAVAARRAPGGGPADGGEAPAAGRAIAFGLGWTVLGWLPLFMTSVIWQPYYALLGALGAWIAIAAGLARRPWVATPLVLALALLSGARADTPSREWGNEWVHRYGRTFMGHTESYLRGRHPTLPPHARLFFTALPRGVVFVTGRGDAPALRVWYGLPSIRGDLWSDYRPRAAGEPPGPDLFFRFDSLAGWVEVATGPERLDEALAANPRWREDHEHLARIFTEADDLRAAAGEYAKLAGAHPDRADYAYLTALCLELLGEPAAADWYRRAAALPGADDRMRAKARAAPPAPP